MRSKKIQENKVGEEKRKSGIHGNKQGQENGIQDNPGMGDGGMWNFGRCKGSMETNLEMKNRKQERKKWELGIHGNKVGEENRKQESPEL